MDSPAELIKARALLQFNYGISFPILLILLYPSHNDLDTLIPYLLYFDYVIKDKVVKEGLKQNANGLVKFANENSNNSFALTMAQLLLLNLQEYGLFQYKDTEESKAILKKLLQTITQNVTVTIENAAHAEVLQEILSNSSGLATDKLILYAQLLSAKNDMEVFKALMLNRTVELSDANNIEILKIKSSNEKIQSALFACIRLKFLIKNYSQCHVSTPMTQLQIILRMLLTDSSLDVTTYEITKICEQHFDQISADLPDTTDLSDNENTKTLQKKYMLQGLKTFTTGTRIYTNPSYSETRRIEHINDFITPKGSAFGFISLAISAFIEFMKNIIPLRNKRAPSSCKEEVNAIELPAAIQDHWQRSILVRPC